MREIKFRAWHKEQELMLTINCIDWVSQAYENDKVGYVSFKEGIDVWQENIEGYSRYEKEYACDLEEVKLMQYTGLNDKNGKEIYDGDIVKIYGGPDGDGLAKIIFERGAFEYFDLQYFMGQIGRREITIFREPHIFRRTPEKYIEVIGNIYQNPDLDEGYSDGEKEVKSK